MTSTIKFDRWYNTNDVLVADGTNGFPNGRNLLYNGAMQVAQRGTSETGITSSGYYTADRWFYFDSLADAVITQTVESDAPSGSGFDKSLKIDITTAESSLDAAETMRFRQSLEGQDLIGLAKGSADAKSLTLSFWVKSNTTGSYIAELFDRDNSRQVSASYSISSADTWEKKTLTFSGDTTGVLDNDNAVSLDVNFWLAAGSDYTSGTLGTTWATSVSANRAVGQVNVAASTSNYWQVTGVQLEAGTVATTFEHKAYGVELAECQRYYWKVAEGSNSPICNIAAYNTGSGYGVLHFPVAMRIATPSLDQITGTNYYKVFGNNGNDAFDSISSLLFGQYTHCEVNIASGVTFAQGYAYWCRGDTTNSYVALDAEL